MAHDIYKTGKDESKFPNFFHYDKEKYKDSTNWIKLVNKHRNPQESTAEKKHEKKKREKRKEGVRGLWSSVHTSLKATSADVD